MFSRDFPLTGLLPTNLKWSRTEPKTLVKLFQWPALIKPTKNKLLDNSFSVVVDTPTWEALQPQSFVNYLPRPKLCQFISCRIIVQGLHPVVQFPDLWSKPLIIELPAREKVINKIFHLTHLCFSCHSPQDSNVETTYTIFQSYNPVHCNLKKC